MAELSKLIDAVSKIADECDALDPDSRWDPELVAAVFARRTGRGPVR